MLDDFQDNDPVKNSEFLDEFRQRLNSQPIENIEERKKDISKSQHIFLGTILGVGLAGIASWFILSPEYDKTENIEIPVVRRTNTAVKVQPVNPGGMEILNQDKAVYDIVENSNADTAKVENILPLPEEPTLPTLPQKVLDEKTETAVAETNKVIETAEKIIVELRGGLPATSETGTTSTSTDEAVDALISTFGFDRNTASKAVNLAKEQGATELEEIIALALRNIK